MDNDEHNFKALKIEQTNNGFIVTTIHYNLADLLYKEEHNKGNYSGSPLKGEQFIFENVNKLCKWLQKNISPTLDIIDFVRNLKGKDRPEIYEDVNVGMVVGTNVGPIKLTDISAGCN